MKVVASPCLLRDEQEVGNGLPKKIETGWGRGRKGEVWKGRERILEDQQKEGIGKGITVKGGISGIIPINYLLIFVLMPFFSFC